MIYLYLLEKMKIMYYDTLYLMNSLIDYASPKSKLTNMVKSGELIRIRRGLYVKGNDYDRKTLANVIYGPSYISFEYALSWYGMIPERVEAVTSAVYNKNKDREFDTPAGRFVYRYINPAVYFYGIVREELNGEPFLVASKEKALCDLLYKIKKSDAGYDIESLLFNDLRINEAELLSLSKNDIGFFAQLYGKIIITKLSEYLNKRIR